MLYCIQVHVRPARRRFRSPATVARSRHRCDAVARGPGRVVSPVDAPWYADIIAVKRSVTKVNIMKVNA